MLSPQLLRVSRFMLDDNRSYTTISMYVRDIRTVMNEAISLGVLDNSYYPFGRGKYEVPVGEGRKLALSLQTIKQIYQYDNPADPVTSRYRDLWMFSYLCNGANFNDILRLKFKNINGNEITFLRGKTINTTKKKKSIVVFLTDEMREIINRVGNPVQLPNNYIFPYLDVCDSMEDEYKKVKEIVKRTNKHLKRITDALGIPAITTYTARHSFATVLKRSGANLAFISESLGHSDLRTTENYLGSFETEEREKNARLLMSFDKNIPVENIIPENAITYTYSYQAV
jgi:integrase